MPEPRPPAPRELLLCGVCERKVKKLEPCTFTFVLTEQGEVRVPVHLGCFAKLIAGEVSREVVGVLRDDEEPGGLDYEKGLDLNGTLARIVERLISDL